MAHYIVELIVWSLIAYFIGCVIGWLLRSMFGADRTRCSARNCASHQSRRTSTGT